MTVLPRQYYGNNNGNCYEDAYGQVNCYNSAWENWARWLVLALIIIGAFLIFFLFSCLTARRRRRLGYAPYRGTGWAAGRTPAGHAPAQYNAQPYYANPQQEQGPIYNNSNNPPPAYGESAGYYGNRDNVELQQPSSTYQRDAYAPPKGPPPGQL